MLNNWHNRLGVTLWLCLTFYIASPSYALTVVPQDDGNFTIVNENGTTSRDLPFKTIEDNYKKYKSEYWTKAYTATKGSWNTWAKKHGNGGNFK